MPVEVERHLPNVSVCALRLLGDTHQFNEA